MGQLGRLGQLSGHNLPENKMPHADGCIQLGKWSSPLASFSAQGYGAHIYVRCMTLQVPHISNLPPLVDVNHRPHQASQIIESNCNDSRIIENFENRSKVTISLRVFTHDPEPQNLVFKLSAVDT